MGMRSSPFAVTGNGERENDRINNKQVTTRRIRYNRYVMSGKKPTDGNRSLSQRVKTAKGRALSSTLWLQRHLNDPYVQKAQREGYRARAAYKLIELDDKTKLIKKGMSVVDLGAAPGGWAQVALQRGASRVIGIDLLQIEPLAGAEFVQMDFNDDDAPDRLKAMLNGEADLVVSDLAPNTIGHKSTDHLRQVALVELAAHFAVEVLKPGGSFVAKVFQGGTSNDVLTLLKQHFKTIKHIKPPSSRKDSSETFVVAQGFKG